MKNDTPEMIQRCLSCTRNRCTNCYCHQAKENRGRKRVIAFRDGEEDMLFDSAEDAGDFFGVTAGCIRQAVKKGYNTMGYHWRYA